MRTITATHSTFVKRVLPFLVIAGVCSWCYWSDRDGRSTESLATYLVIGVAGTAFMVAFLRKGLWRMADTVEDCGDSLVVTRWRAKVVVPLSTVWQIRRQPSLASSEITLILDELGAFGSEIQFYAADKRKVPDIDETLDDLARRVGASGQNHVPTLEPSNPNALREWRNQVLNTAVLFVAWVSIFGIAAPIINVDVETYSTQFFLSVQLAVIFAVAPSFLFIRGLKILLYRDGAVESPWAVRLGAIASCAYLAIVPHSFNLSMQNLQLHPSWIVVCGAGTIAAFAYLWYAYKQWGDRRSK